MPLSYQVLGAAGQDNALLVRIDTGQQLVRLLFDCGEDCLDALSFGEIQSIDHLLFSHLHMDHIAGFDTFFRATFNRATQVNHVWGPPGTGEIMHHRFRGFLWNLHADQGGEWIVHDLHDTHTEQAQLLTREAFATPHPLPSTPGCSLESPAWSVSALTMDHMTPSLAYVVRERSRLNVDPARLASLGLQPGPWLRQLKAAEGDLIEISGAQHDREQLRAQLLVESPGDSIAYLTDFLLDERARDRLLPAISGCQTLICESQYGSADLALARRHHHMTAAQAAELARAAGVGRLILFHVSQRYRRSEWQAMLGEAQSIFEATSFPDHWNLQGSS